MRDDAVRPFRITAGKMIVSLDIVYHSQFYFHPLRFPEGKLFGVELITNFTTVDASVRIPTELIIPHITQEQELILFHEKLSLLRSHQHFFVDQALVAWVNISESIVDTILLSPEIIVCIQRLPFIKLTINESYTGLNLGRANLQLNKLSQHFPLVLANFGAGIATTTSIIDGLFGSIMLDKNFVQKHIHSRSFVPFMQAILGQISPFCSEFLIAGIDDEHSLMKAQPLGFTAMQGNLWPAVPAQTLSSLLVLRDGIPP